MRALVTGGGGFLGSRMVELLLSDGADVRVVARNRYPGVEKLGAEGFAADIREPGALRQVMKGVDVVYHVAALAGFWGPVDDYRRINVDGTRNVIDAMREGGVGRLVYTSTPSVIGYDLDVENGGMDLPYASTHESPYPQTKAEAERLVREANGGDMATVCLRPHLIIGPGDNNLMPRLVERAATGRLIQVGDGANKVDLTYVDNAAWAHLDAAKALTAPDVACAGNAYFISNGEPVVLWAWLRELCEGLGIQPVQRRASLGAARALGAVMEFAWSVLPLAGEPRITRFLASAFARSHWYDMGPAQRDFGYQVRVPMKEGTDRTIAWLRDRVEHSHRREVA